MLQKLIYQSDISNTLLIQWTKATVNNNTTVYFPSAFTSLPFMVVCINIRMNRTAGINNYDSDGITLTYVKCSAHTVTTDPKNTNTYCAIYSIGI